MIITRPELTEAAPYYFTYIDQVGDTGVIETLRSQLYEFGAYSSQITEERSLHRYSAGKWSIREVLNHITDAERVFSSERYGSREALKRLYRASITM